MPKPSVALVVPIYHATPTPDEALVIRHFLTAFNQTPLVFMAHPDLDVAPYQSLCRNSPLVSFERFEWRGYEAYSQLMVSAEFYDRFAAYEYILLAQPDTFVFDTDLEKWCALGYDFIGGVIHDSTFGHTMIEGSRAMRLLNRLGLVRSDTFRNGGLSLRRVAAFRRMARLCGPLIRSGKLSADMEDAFWSVWAPLLNPFFKVAPIDVSLGFCVELPPPDDDHLEQSYQKMQRIAQPFGCHNWRNLGYSYWKPIIEEKARVQLDALAD